MRAQKALLSSGAAGNGLGSAVPSGPAFHLCRQGAGPAGVARAAGLWPQQGPRPSFCPCWGCRAAMVGVRRGTAAAAARRGAWEARLVPGWGAPSSLWVILTWSRALQRARGPVQGAWQTCRSAQIRLSPKCAGVRGGTCEDLFSLFFLLLVVSWAKGCVVTVQKQCGFPAGWGDRKKNQPSGLFSMQ